MTHPDKILLLIEECKNLQSASTHLRFSMERTQELIQRVRDEISADKMAEIYEAVFMLAPELDKIAKQAADYSGSLIKRVQVP